MRLALVLTLPLSLNLLSSASFAAEKQFPPGFKWCVATAAYQIEGGDDKSDFWHWEVEKSGRVGTHLSDIVPGVKAPVFSGSGGAMAAGGDPCPVFDTEAALDIERDTSKCADDPSITAEFIDHCAGMKIETDHTVKFPQYADGKFSGKYSVCEFSGVTVGHWDQIEKAWNASQESGAQTPSPATNDIDLLKNIGANSYRMSVEWAKIQPVAPTSVPTINEQTGEVVDNNEYDYAAIEHYAHEIALLRKQGIEPMVTLFHFTMPEWLREQKGWENPNAPKYFAAFTKKVYESLGGQVTYWFTLNEPMVHISAGYVAGVHPPGQTLDGGGNGKIEPIKIYKHIHDLKGVLVGILSAHAESYTMLHNLWTSEGKKKGWPWPQVGVAAHLRIFDAVDKTPLSKNQLVEKLLYYGIKNLGEFNGIKKNNPSEDEILAGSVDYVWNWMFIDAIETGILKLDPFLPDWAGIKIPHLAQSEDYSGINYYSRDMIDHNKPSPQVNADALKDPAHRINDIGWEIYPQGFTRIMRLLDQQVFADRSKVGLTKLSLKTLHLPMLVSENGIADRRDVQREQFLKDHFTAMWNAMHPAAGERGEGWMGGKPAMPVNVIGYCHWSLTGNFEWNSGYYPDFGLSQVDMRRYVADPANPGKQIVNPNYLNRTVRNSTHVFTEASSQNGLSF